MSEPLFTSAAVERVVGEVVAQLLEAAYLGKLVEGFEISVDYLPDDTVPPGQSKRITLTWPKVEKVTA
jgi:hypothetical protein